MQIKAVFLDLDGTSLNSNHQLSPRLVSALNKLHQHQVEVVFCTGRGFVGSKLYADQLGFCNYIINFNAARIFDLKRNQLMYEATLEGAIVKKIFAFAKQHQVLPSFYHDDVFYTQEVDDDLLYYRKLTGEQHKIFNCITEVLNLPITKGLYIIPETKMHALTALAVEYFPEASVYSSSDTYLEIMPKNITKAVGVQNVIETLQIHPEECMAFGDQWNDYDMLNYVGKGFVMANAPAALKAQFPPIQHTLSNDCDGVALQLEHHFNFRYDHH